MRRTVRTVFGLSLAAGLMLSGATMARAAIDPSAYKLQTAGFSVSSGQARAETLKCGGDRRAVPGGAYFHGVGQPPDPSQAMGRSVPSSAPTTSDRAWYAGGSASTGLILQLVAQCVPESQVHGFDRASTEVSIPTTKADGARVSCPGREHAFTGGAVWHRPGDPPASDFLASLRTESSSPTTDGKGWFADGYNYSGEDLDLRVSVLCLPRRRLGDVLVKTKELSMPNGVPDGGRLACPHRRRVLTGGAFYHRLGQPPDPTGAYGALLSNSAPSMNARNWYADGNNFYGFADLQLEIVVLCVGA